MSGTPDISYNTFDYSKNWHRVTFLQNGRPIVDSDLNEAQDINRYLTWLANSTVLTSYTRIGDGFKTKEYFASSNNFLVNAGAVCVFGTIVLIGNDFAYVGTSPNFYNRMGEGSITALNNTNLTITDNNKNWIEAHNLGGCRIVMLDGLEAGNVFTIQGTWNSGWNSSTYTLDSLGFVGGVAVGDSYIMIPPALSTPAADRVDKVYIQSWFEDINEAEDPDVRWPGFPEAVSERQQLRWCVRVAEGTTDPISGQAVEGAVPASPDDENPFAMHFMELATLSRLAGDDTIIDSYITNVRGIELPLPELTQEMVDARTSSWGGDFTSLDQRLDYTEDRTRPSKTLNGSFEIGSVVGTNIEKWIPSNGGTSGTTGWILSSSEPHLEAKSVKIPHTTRLSGVTEYLTSYPFVVRGNQPLKFRAAMKGYQLGMTVKATLTTYANLNKWDDAFLQEEIINFGVGYTNWTSDEIDVTVHPDAQWGKVVLSTQGQGNIDVYFDDVRVEYFDSGNTNTDIYIPMHEILAGRFDEGFKRWKIDHWYQGYAEIIENAGELNTLKLTGSTALLEATSWPASIGAEEYFDDLIIAKVEAKYSGVNLTTPGDGPQIAVQFIDKELNSVAHTNDPGYMGVMDWGPASAQTANPGGSTFNTYWKLFSVPKEAAACQLRLGYKGVTGSVEFRNAQLLRFSRGTTALANAVYHDIAVNGEFGIGSITTVGAVTPPYSIMLDEEFMVNAWTQTNPANLKVIHWLVKNNNMQIPDGERSVMFSLEEAYDSARIYQDVPRVITEQDRIHGFILDFDYFSDDNVASNQFKLFYTFYDSDENAVGLPEYIVDLTEDVDTDPTLDGKWRNRSVYMTPPTANDRIAVRLRYGFEVKCVTPSPVGSGYGYGYGGGTLSRIYGVSGVKLWSRTVPSPLTEPSLDQSYAFQGYKTWMNPDLNSGDLVEKTYALREYTGFYKDAALIVPSSTNHFLLEDDADVMRHSVHHAHRHYPAEANPPWDDYIDPIPIATQTQTGLLSYLDKQKLDAAKQSIDFKNMLFYGVHHGLDIANAGGGNAYVYPGAAIDQNGNILQLTTTQTIAITAGDATNPRIDVVLLYQDSNGDPAITIITEGAAAIPLMPANDKYPQYYVVLAVCTVLATTTQWNLISPSPVELLVNAEFVGLRDLVTFRDPTVYHFAGTPIYKVVDYRAATYRMVFYKQSSRSFYDQLAGSAKAPSGTNLESVPFYDSDWVPIFHTVGTLVQGLTLGGIGGALTDGILNCLNDLDITSDNDMSLTPAGVLSLLPGGNIVLNPGGNTTITGTGDALISPTGDVEINPFGGDIDLIATSKINVTTPLVDGNITFDNANTVEFDDYVIFYRWFPTANASLQGATADLDHFYFNNNSQKAYMSIEGMAKTEAVPSDTQIQNIKIHVKSTEAANDHVITAILGDYNYNTDTLSSIITVTPTIIHSTKTFIELDLTGAEYTMDASIPKYVSLSLSTSGAEAWGTEVVVFGYVVKYRRKTITV